MTPSTGTLSFLGETVQLSAVVLDASGVQITGKTTSWSSSNDAVGTVSSSGLVTAHASGSITISATADGVTGDAAIEIEQTVEAISISPENPTIAGYGPVSAVALEATALDAGGSEVAGVAAFDWATSDDQVARVDDGTVTTLGTGEATITASASGVHGTTTVTSSPPVVPTNGLLAHYSFTDNALDRSGNGRHGTVQGPTLTGDRFGNESAAYQFDGTDDFIEIAGSFNELTVPFTFSVWLFQEAVPAEFDWGHVFMLHDPPGAPTSYQGFWLIADLRFSLGYGDGGFPAGDARRSGRATGELDADRWIHVVTTVNGPTDMTFYIDAVGATPDYSGTGAAMSHNSWPTRIGRGTLGNSTVTFFEGRLDDLRLYDRALTADEVRQLFEEGGF